MQPAVSLQLAICGSLSVDPVPYTTIHASGRQQRVEVNPLCRPLAFKAARP